MTNSKRCQRTCSFRVPKSPSLLDRAASGSLYDHLEEAALPWESGDADFKGSRPSKEEAQQKTVWSQGSWGRRAASLRVRKVRKEEAPGMGEAAHSLGPGDGHLLIGESYSKAGSRMKKCKKVDRALQRGWETFLTNVYSLTLSRPTSAAASPHPGGGTR